MTGNRKRIVLIIARHWFKLFPSYYKGLFLLSYRFKCWTCLLFGFPDTTQGIFIMKYARLFHNEFDKSLWKLHTLFPPNSLCLLATLHQPWFFVFAKWDSVHHDKSTLCNHFRWGPDYKQVIPFWVSERKKEMLGLNINQKNKLINKQTNKKPKPLFPHCKLLFKMKVFRNLFRNICCFSERKSTTEVLGPWNCWHRFVNALNKGLGSWRCLNTPLSIACGFYPFELFQYSVP